MTAGPDHVCGPDTCGANFAYDAAEAVIRRIDLRQPWTSREIGSAVVDAVRPGIGAEATASERQRIRQLYDKWHAEAGRIPDGSDIASAVRATLRQCAVELADLLDGAA